MRLVPAIAALIVASTLLACSGSDETEVVSFEDLLSPDATFLVESPDNPQDVADCYGTIAEDIPFEPVAPSYVPDGFHVTAVAVTLPLDFGEGVNPRLVRARFHLVPEDDGEDGPLRTLLVEEWLAPGEDGGPDPVTLPNGEPAWRQRSQPPQPPFALIEFRACDVRIGLSGFFPEDTADPDAARDEGEAELIAIAESMFENCPELDS